MAENVNAWVCGVEDGGSGIQAMADELQRRLSAYVAEKKLKPSDILALSTAPATAMVTPERDEFDMSHPRAEARHGLVVTLIHAELDPFTRV